MEIIGRDFICPKCNQKYTLNNDIYSLTSEKKMKNFSSRKKNSTVCIALKVKISGSGSEII